VNKDKKDRKGRGIVGQTPLALKKAPGWPLEALRAKASPVLLCLSSSKRFSLQSAASPCPIDALAGEPLGADRGC
jgi:hypothetical protein